MWWCQYWLCGGVGHSRVEAISQIRSAVGRKASARATGRFHFPGSPNAVVCLGGPVRGQGCIPQEVTVLLCRDRGPVWEHLEPLDRAPSASRLRHPIKSESSASVSPGRTPLPPPPPPKGSSFPATSRECCPSLEFWGWTRLIFTRHPPSWPWLTDQCRAESLPRGQIVSLSLPASPGACNALGLGEWRFWQKLFHPWVLSPWSLFFTFFQHLSSKELRVLPQHCC